MDLDLIINILVAAIASGTPFVFAALGELVTEKSGVLNLGVEGMMLVGAICGFMGMAATGSVFVAVICGMAAGALMSMIFAVLTLSLMANQVASGLALTIFGVGLSAFLGLDYTSVALAGVPEIHIPLLSDIPALGPLLFSHDLLIYFSLLIFAGVSYFLNKTKSGLILRGIGEAPTSAHALGYNVIGIRYLAVLFGGAMAGLGGVYLSIAYTPMWVESAVADFLGERFNKGHNIGRNGWIDGGKLDGAFLDTTPNGLIGPVTVQNSLGCSGVILAVNVGCGG